MNTDKINRAIIDRAISVLDPDGLAAATVLIEVVGNGADDAALDEAARSYALGRLNATVKPASTLCEILNEWPDKAARSSAARRQVWI